MKTLPRKPTTTYRRWAEGSSLNRTRGAAPTPSTPVERHPKPNTWYKLKRLKAIWARMRNESTQG